MAESEALAEAFPKAASELKEPDAWKHHEIELNKLGTYYSISLFFIKFVN